MRIGISCNTIDPLITQGKLDGIGMYTKHLFNELTKQHQSIIPCTFSYTSSTLLSFATPFSPHHQLEKQIDLFHSTDHQVPKLKNTPTIATLHDALMFKHPEWYDANWLALKNWLRKKSIHWADHFITVSQTMVTELIEEMRIKEEKISVIYNGILPEWFIEASSEKKQEVLKRLNLPDQFLLFTGTLQPKKNVVRLIQAYLNLPPHIQSAYPLVIVGKAGQGMQDSLLAIQNLITQKKGFWLNYTTTADLQVLFQCAALYVYPSLHEGFGLTLLEAFASKTPVITSNVAALPETAGGAACLIDPYNISEITEAIKTLLTHSTLREQLIQKGFTRAQEFSWEKCAENTLRVYQSII